MHRASSTSIVEHEPTSPRLQVTNIQTLSLTLVHSTPLGEPSTIAARRSELTDCDPSENVLDVLVDARSILEIGKHLPDPLRILDLYVLQRLILASRWRIPVPLHRLSDTMTDTSTFLFAHDLNRRGYDCVNPDAVKNSIKRLRAVFRLVVPTPRDWFIRYEGQRGYLADLRHLTIEIIHLPQ